MSILGKVLQGGATAAGTALGGPLGGALAGGITGLGSNILKGNSLGESLMGGAAGAAGGALDKVIPTSHGMNLLDVLNKGKQVATGSPFNLGNFGNQLSL